MWPWSLIRPCNLGHLLERVWLTDQEILQRIIAVPKGQTGVPSTEAFTDAIKWANRIRMESGLLHAVLEGKAVLDQESACIRQDPINLGASGDRRIWMLDLDHGPSVFVALTSEQAAWLKTVEGVMNVWLLPAERWGDDLGRSVGVHEDGSWALDDG